MFVLLSAGIALVAGPPSLLMLPIGAVVGPIVGLSSGEPAFTPRFKAMLLAGLVAAAASVFVGVRNRSRLWGQLLVPIGTALWVICGLAGFGPQ